MSFSKPQKSFPINPVALPREFFGIEDVLIPTEKSEFLDGGEVKPGGIEEIILPSPERTLDSTAVIMRKHIAITVLTLWAVWTLVGLIAFAFTGNAVLLISSPAIMSIPLYKMLGYYF